MDDDQALLTVGQAANMLERSTEQVRRYLREGRLTGQRMGGQWFINQRDLNRFATASREKSSFLARVGAAETIRPLDPVIGIVEGSGMDISRGKRDYLRAAARKAQHT